MSMASLEIQRKKKKTQHNKAKQKLQDFHKQHLYTGEINNMNPCFYFQSTRMRTNSVSKFHVSINVISLLVILGLISLLQKNKNDG